MIGPRVHLPAERLYALVLWLYPEELRAEYGPEMLDAFRAWRAGRPGSGLAGLRFWADVLLDTVTSVPREWFRAIRDRLKLARSSATPEAEPAPPYRWAAVAALAVFLLYVATLAPTIGFWDSGEYITAAHILGIPHPPGSPLFVLLAHAWESLLAPTGLSVAVRINLFTAVLMAAAHGFWFLVVDRALAGAASGRLLRRVGAAAAVVVSATAFTVWNQADVTEKVYAIAFFTTALVTWLALRWRDTGRRTRGLVVAAVVLALSATNHLMGVLVVPALLVFVFLVDRRALLRPRLWLAGAPLVALALSVQFFLPIRAAERPVLSEADPACPSAVSAVASVYTGGHAGCSALSSVLTRRQYGMPPITVDPTAYPQEVRPRSASLIAAQVENYVQYFDWQWARSVAGHHTLFGGARPLFTLAFLLLGLVGLATYRRRDAAGAAYLVVLFGTLSLGLVAYLNFRYGYSTGHGHGHPMAEVRERDYFFVIGFSVWGLLAGMGIATLWARAAATLRNRIRWPRLAAAPVLALALLPFMLNGHWASRARDHTARDWAYNVLMSVRPYGVLFTNGDNDTFPLWYLQEVEGVRRDVTVIVGSYLGTAWYARQIRDLTRPCPPGVDPDRTPTRIVCQRPFVPSALPAPLAKAGWTRSARPPRDSVLPLTDAQIRQVAARAFVAREGMTLHAGAIDTTIHAGTTLFPSDTFTAAILQHALGQRPIYFMPGSPAVTKLGLFAHTVREGITWRIENGPVANRPPDVVKLPDNSLTPVAGAAIDLATTDTLVWWVYQRRGRILNPSMPWVDAATDDILMQYAYTSYAAAEGHKLNGDTRDVVRDVRRAEWWQALASE